MFLIDWPGGSWEASLRLTLTILAVYLAAMWITLIFWTYRDIRQRSRDPIIQTVAVALVLVFFLPGHWIYLILRPRYTLTELYERSLEEEALLQELEDQKACPNCNRRIRDEFLLCPFCRASLKEPCRACSRPLSRAWLACPYCGMEKPAAMRPGPRQQQVRQPRPQQTATTASVPPPAPRPEPVRRGTTTPRPGFPGSTSGNGRPATPEPAQDAGEIGMIDATRD